MDDDLIAAHGTEPKLMPYLHLPVQAGSDRVLKAMNRKHTPRATCASSSGSGRRGPTSRSRATSSSASPARPRRISPRRSSLVRAVGYAQAYSFKYSPRPGTPAAGGPRFPRR
jgi:tRNA-2-methylthio-N6-dimethylallyladenosine synthase